MGVLERPCSRRPSSVRPSTTAGLASSSKAISSHPRPDVLDYPAVRVRKGLDHGEIENGHCAERSAERTETAIYTRHTT